MVSIVMLCKNRRPLSLVSLDSVVRNTPEPYELVVVDAGSSDGLWDDLNRDARIDVMIGLPKERDAYDISRTPAYFSRGIRASTGDVVVKMDGDIFVAPGWLEPLVELLDVEHVGVSSYRFGNGGGNMEALRAEGSVLAERDNYWIGDIMNGGIWVMRRSFLDSMGGYSVDASWGRALDSGFSRRVRDAGYDLAYCKDIRATHLGGSFRTETVRGTDSEAIEHLRVHHPAAHEAGMRSGIFSAIDSYGELPGT